SCMTRGLTAVVRIRPNEDEFSDNVGFEKFAWLKKLKASARKSSRVRSLNNANFLMTEKSTFVCPGPLMIPTPEFPNAVARPSSPMIGKAFGKQLLLK